MRSIIEEILYVEHTQSDKIYRNSSKASIISKKKGYKYFSD
jgi:hypothetical protein